MKLGQKVLVTWGAYKGLTGVITETRYTKNITLKLGSKPFEIEVSADHLEVVER
jgi:transcription antitermination factor NusG